MNFTIRHAVACAAALAIGFYLGRNGVKATSTGASAHNDIGTVSDWWTYAGSWSA